MSFLVNTCRMTTRTESKGSAGQIKGTYAAAVGTTRLMLDVTSDEPTIGDKEKPVLRGQAYFAYGTAVNASDTFTMLDGIHINKVFAVQSEPTDEVGSGTHLVCEVESITGGPTR